MTVLRCELFPDNVAEAADFHERVLAFRVVDDRRDSDDPYVALERGSARLGLAQRPDVSDRGQRQPPVGVEVVLEVEDVDADRARVAAAGWPVLEDVVRRKWGLRDFRLLDPAGYYWRITSS